MATADYLLPFQPSLAQATNTRLDSACKHIQQCRVATDEMLSFVGDVEEIQRNKYRYCIHKDELVVGLGRPWSVKFHALFCLRCMLISFCAGIPARS